MKPISIGDLVYVLDKITLYGFKRHMKYIGHIGVVISVEYDSNTEYQVRFSEDDTPLYFYNEELELIYEQ